MALKPLSECEFTAFISYAHADDVYSLDWISQFCTEFERQLRSGMRSTPLPGMHLSARDGPVRGFLGDELKQRIAASYAMIIVVHDNYVLSDWCREELVNFKALFGEEGFRERLYVVALSKKAIDEVTTSPRWRELVPDRSLLWFPFFDDATNDRPIPVYMAPGTLSTQFTGPFVRLRDDFVGRLKRAAAPRPASAWAAPAAAPVATALPVAGEMVFGFTSPERTAVVAAVATSLQALGVATRTIEQSAMAGGFTEFANATSLVLAFDDAPPMMDFYPGGHLAMQRDGWVKRGKPASAIVWLDLRDKPDAPAAGAAAFVASLGVAPVTPAALRSRFAPQPVLVGGPGDADGVHIYIESNRNERNLWESLGEQLREQWDALFPHLAPERVPPLILRARGLPIEQINILPPLVDADGVVLLWGKKTPETLGDQIDKVERKLLRGNAGVPCITAYLTPPQTDDNMTSYIWSLLRIGVRDEDSVDIVEPDDLTRFLKKVLERRRKRLTVAGASPAVAALP